MEKQNTEVVATTFTEFVYDSAGSAFRALAWMYSFLAYRGEEVPEELSVIQDPGRYRLDMYRDFRTGRAWFAMNRDGVQVLSWKGTLEREGLSFLYLLAEREVR